MNIHPASDTTRNILMDIVDVLLRQILAIRYAFGPLVSRNECIDANVDVCCISMKPLLEMRFCTYVCLVIGWEGRCLIFLLFDGDRLLDVSLRLQSSSVFL